MRVLLAFVALAGLAAAQDRAWRTYDARALELAATPAPNAVDPRRPLASMWEWWSAERDAVPVDGALAPHATDDGSGWRDVLDAALAVRAVDRRDPGEAGFDLDVGGGLVRARATPAQHAVLADVLGDLTGHLLRPVDLELVVLAAADVPAGTSAVLGAAEVSALLEGAAPLDRADLRGRLDVPARLGAARLAAVVAEYDVLAAQWEAMLDPAIGLVHTGTEVGVHARALDDGALFLRVWGRRTREVGPRRDVTLPAFGDVALELPAVHGAVRVGSARVEDGGALLLGGAETDEVWLVRARRASDVGTARPFVPVGRLTARPHVPLPQPARGPRATTGGEGATPVEVVSPLVEAYALDDPARLERAAYDLLELDARIDEARAARGLAGAHARFGDELYVGDDPAQAALVREVLAEARAAFGGTALVEVRLGHATPALAADLARGAVPPEEALAQATERWLGACALGDALLLTGGLEAAYLADFEPAVQQGASAPDPVVDVLFDGVALWMMPQRAPGGGVSALFEFEVQRAEVGDRRHPVGGYRPAEEGEGALGDDSGPFEPVGEVGLPIASRAVLRGPVTLAPGTWTLLGTAALPDAEATLVALAKVELTN